MQTQRDAQGQPPAPAPPPPPAPRVGVTTEQGGRTIVVEMPREVEQMTAQELRALRLRRQELGEQLASTQQRRREVAESLKGADPGARSGIEQRLAVLDGRIVQLETEIADAGRQLSSVPAGLAAATLQRSDPGGEEEAAFFGGLLTGAAVIGAVVWIRSRRRGGRRQEAVVAVSQAEQLTRLEQAVETIAIEVERISEGQRFTARLLADQRDRVGTSER